MVYLTRLERFNAAHRLWVDDWSEEKNKEIFGKCKASTPPEGKAYICSSEFDSLFLFTRSISCN